MGVRLCRSNAEDTGSVEPSIEEWPFLDQQVLVQARSYGEGNALQPQPTGRDARMRQLLVFTDPDESKMLEAKCLPVFHSP